MVSIFWGAFRELFGLAQSSSVSGTLTHRITTFVRPSFIVHGTNLCTQVFLVNTDDASYFNASRLSINTGTADLLYTVHDHAKRLSFFQKATCSSHRDCGTRGHMVETNRIVELTPPPLL